MSGVNKVILVGRLTKDPDVRFATDGSAVCNITIATSETWKDKNTGEKKEKAEFHRVVLWRKLAELAGEYLSKGRQVYVEGRLQTRSYEKDGQTHYITEVRASWVEFLGGGRQSSGGGDDKGGYQAPPTNNEPYDDDIPF